MQQPSAQGIASLYRGNPQPLQQSIQKDQQAKPGLPPDLQKMLALQIVTNEEDSATAQKAMDQLRQMGGQSGKPPTVMASLQQQAEQKLQAQAVQAQQKQQGIQSLLQQAPASGVPEGTPQPEDQPEAQGIDQSDRVAFAGAAGGIVAFANEGEVPKPSGEPLDEKAKQALEEAQRSGDRNAMIMTLKKLGAAGYDLATIAPRALMGVAEDISNTRLGRALGVDFQLPQAAYGGDRASMTPMSDRVTRAEAEQNQPRPAAPASPKGAMPEPGYTRKAMEGDPRLNTPPTLPADSSDIKKIVEPPKNLPTTEAADRPSSIADISALAKRMQASQTTPAPAADSEAIGIQKSVMRADPAARAAEEIQKFSQALPAPDTTQHDRLIAELEKRKQALAPKQGYEGLMEYLGEISRADSRGRGSFAAGAAGAARLNDLNKDRALQQFELSKQAIEVSQKKLDTVRAYAEKKYSIGKSTFDQVYKDRYDAAKEIGRDEAAAKKQAKEEALKYFELAQQQTLERERIRAQASNRPFDLQGEYAKAMLAGDEKRAKTLLNAMNAVGEAKKPGLDMDLRKKFSELPDVKLPFMQYSLLKAKANPSEKDIAALQAAEANLAKLARANNIDPSKLGFEVVATSGKAPPPPPGFTPDKP